MLVSRGPSRPFLRVVASSWVAASKVAGMALAGLGEFMYCYCKLSLLSQEPLFW